MEIIKTNVLTSAQYHDARTLVDLCRMEDHTKGIHFFDADVNYDKEFPCFYLLYKDHILVSFLSIFLPDDTECEIYAHTLPKFRRKGYFKQLYDAAYENIRACGWKKICFVNEPCCQAGEKALSAIGATFESSEYLMAYNMRLAPATQGILTLHEEEDGEVHVLHTYRKETLVGTVHYHIEEGVATLFGVFVEEKYRGRRFGVETLNLAVKYLMDAGCERIILHVSGANKIAYHLYSHHGFVHVEQLDYWMKKLGIGEKNE